MTLPPGMPGRAGLEPSSEPSSEPSREAFPVEWTFDPWRDRPVTAGIAAFAVLALWLIIAACRFPWLLALAQAIVVASPLAPAFVPAACRIEVGGAARRGPLGWMRRSWADIRRIDDVPVGVLLSPYASRHWLDATRALTLPIPRPRRAELATLVRARWRAHER